MSITAADLLPEEQAVSASQCCFNVHLFHFTCNYSSNVAALLCSHYRGYNPWQLRRHGLNLKIICTYGYSCGKRQKQVGSLLVWCLKSLGHLWWQSTTKKAKVWHFQHWLVGCCRLRTVIDPHAALVFLRQDMCSQLPSVAAESLQI